MKDDPRPKHEFDEAAPTVLHHHEEDETILAQWLRRGIEKGPKFWVAVVGVVGVVVVLGYIVGGLAAGRAVVHEAWIDMVTAKSADDRIRLAESEAATPVAPWALLQAAEERYREGFEDLPANREAAGPLLNKAYELFGQARREAAKDSPVRRLAALGMARSLEARNELDKAITQYESVAKEFPETPEGEQAKRLAERLKRPESRAFYEKLYAYKPREATLPPGGSTTFPGLNLPTGHPPLGGPTTPAGALPPVFGPGSLPPSTSEVPPPPTPESTAPKAPAVEPPPTGAPATTPAPAPEPSPKDKADVGKELPTTPFTGEPK